MGDNEFNQYSSTSQQLSANFSRRLLSEAAAMYSRLASPLYIFSHGFGPYSLRYGCQSARYIPKDFCKRAIEHNFVSSPRRLDTPKTLSSCAPKGHGMVSASVLSTPVARL